MGKEAGDRVNDFSRRDDWGIYSKAVEFKAGEIVFRAPGMILAIILLSVLSSAGSVHAVAPVSAQSSTQSTTAGSAANSANTQTSGSQSKADSSKPPAAKPAVKPKASGTHKKKVAQIDCNSASAMPSSPDGGKSATASTGGPASTTSGSTNCAPKKVIVRQGGISEPSIQLENGPVAKDNQQKAATTEMLGATEQNLKKLAGRQLDENQQNLVSQARQFMDESKKAIDSGDLDRARTLALKAKLLSEDLVKPESQ